MKNLLNLLLFLSFNISAQALPERDVAFDSIDTVSPFATSLFRILNYKAQPILSADILIGNGINDPFPGNHLVTNEHGRFHLPAAWTTPLPLTILHPDYLTTTYTDVVPASITDLTIEEQFHPTSYGIKGETKGFGKLRRDGKVDFAIVMKGFQKSDLIDFDLRSILSAEMETIPVAGKQIQIPSNFTLPEQKEAFPIPVKFNKPNFYLGLSEKGQHELIAIHGRFPVKEVTKALRNGESFFNLINFFEFLSGGHETVLVEQRTVNEDMKVNQIPFSQSIAITAPKIPHNTKIISIALIDRQGTLLPSDIKRLKSNESQALTITADRSDKYVLSALVPENPTDLSAGAAFTYGSSFSRMSVTLERAGSGNPEFLSLVAPPILSGDQLHVVPPRKPTHIEDMGTIFTLSSIETVKLSRYETVFTKPIWKIYVPHWVDTLTLPDIGLNLDPKKKYRWEAIFLGSRRGVKSKFKGVIDIEKVSHISRSYLDL